ncbi:hypothetical protein ABIG06_006550 [Bradyrhizobium sp. USDA 326]|uniref:hypothetical protein n=1 Tax=unclassified Bradyrhizobium TaxID=2631580 RepID=UPI0035180D79
MKALHEIALPAGFPGQGTIYDRAKLPVDATGWVWTLNDVSATRLDFRKLEIDSPDLLLAVVKYIADRVTTRSVDDVRNTFDALRFLQSVEHFRTCAATGGRIDLRLIAQLRLVENFAAWRLCYVRAWYQWCAKRNFPQFAGEVAAEMADIRIGGNPKGVAVRTRDPEQGAFDQLETIAIVTKLRELGPILLTAFERTLVWLALAFGSNPKAFSLLREEDYRIVREDGSNVVHHVLKIPRIKKRSASLRKDFHTKRPDGLIGEQIAALIEENIEFRRRCGWPEGCAFPLFRRAEPRARVLDGPMPEYAMHCSTKEITAALKAAVEKLNVISHRTGLPINVTAMRFRRTFVTRAVEENVPPAELAVMVDHSDLQNLKVYYETTSSIVDRLDAALAVKLGPLADAFMGKVVADETEAANGADPTKRIPFFRRAAGQQPERAGNLGTCGAGACAQFAPISCYTCRKFQPWRDGPHREFLEQLCDERERKKAAGLDPQIVGLHDATILAIGEVVAACEGGAE